VQVQYVALRNINLILQKYPQVLATEARVFFCKYNDPIYVKLEKLEIMVALASEQNTTAVLAELKEYAQVLCTSPDGSGTCQDRA
jgi:AP-1 complex subunit beta-1